MYNMYVNGFLMYLYNIVPNTYFQFILMRISLGNCSPDQITCKDGQCIGKKHWLCDGNVCPYNRCDDNSDEDQQICGIVA